eukprot:TRINITY_DN8746_c0_g1_i1.p1 TRINITY_DN8746_c0_g1~~TRINITY_DN8746_c0_g1_i1.p1  ORF type:complete len:564 (-),score=154.55 TRINITY_DN8746_c0_g1_i1:70-1761(-)
MRQWDKRKKITISQRDVPGITRSAIPIWVNAGVQAVSVGVNGASAPPAVPKVFVWSDVQSQTDVIAMWHPFGYGGYSLSDCVTFEDFGHALCWDFRNDNSGPPQMQEVLDVWAAVQAEFPGANITASSYDQFVNELVTIKDQLPVVTDEIGDTWIYGVPSDPLKVAQFREIVRARTECVKSGACDTSDFTFHAFDILLTKVAEHTWGKDVKTFLRDTTNWNNTQFEAAKSGANFQDMINSWVEQREYITNAIAALGDSDFATELKNRLASLSSSVDLTGYQEVDATKIFNCGRFEIGFDSEIGAINHLIDTKTGTAWVQNSSSFFAQFQYQSYDQNDYQNFLSEYMATYPIPSWAWNDFGKPNMQAEHAIYQASLQKLYYRENTTASEFYVYLTMPSTVVINNGAPKDLYIYIALPEDDDTIQIDVVLQNKTATRIAEAAFVTFRPDWVKDTTTLSVDKLGEFISINEVNRNGSIHLHGVGQGVQYTQGANTLSVIGFDTAVVNVGPLNVFPTPLGVYPSSSLGSSFVLYDNLWGTNYVMWYPFLEGEDQLLFRFQLVFSDSS